MQVKLEKTFPVEAPADSAWRFLQDIRAVAACMPGAEITEQVDETHYKGKVKVKLGPATAAFNGDIEVKGIDAERRELHLFGKGTDVKGTSSASMDLMASVRETGEGASELVGVSEVAVTGKMASFGGRMMTQVSDQIINQFAANFATQVAARGEGSEAESAAAKAAEQPKEINVLALAWAALVGFFKSLFGGSSSKPAG